MGNTVVHSSLASNCCTVEIRSNQQRVGSIWGSKRFLQQVCLKQTGHLSTIGCTLETAILVAWIFLWVFTTVFLWTLQRKNKKRIQKWIVRSFLLQWVLRPDLSGDMVASWHGARPWKIPFMLMKLISVFHHHLRSPNKNCSMSRLHVLSNISLHLSLSLSIYYIRIRIIDTPHYSTTSSNKRLVSTYHLRSGDRTSRLIGNGSKVQNLESIKKKP